MKLESTNYTLGIVNDGNYDLFSFNCYLRELLKGQNLHEWHKEQNLESFNIWIKEHLKSRIDRLHFELLPIGSK